MNPLRCPLSAPDPELIHQFLTSLSLDELIFFSEQAFNQLSPAEKVTYDINRFCSDYSDYEGRAGFIRTLLDNAVISAINIPLSYQSNPRIIELIRPQTYEYYIPVAHELHDATSALTDELEQSPASAITVTNPRWVHVDETRKGESPDVAAIGDTVEMLVDVSGYPEGAPVTFDIFDTSCDPAMRVETERGKNEGGIAKIQWVVSDPNERGAELKLCFEANARSKSSGQAPIDLATASNSTENETVAGIPPVSSDGYEVVIVDENDKPKVGIDVCFTVNGVSTIIKSDAAGKAFMPSSDASAGPADVQVVLKA